jgi:hypothetical protein
MPSEVLLFLIIILIAVAQAGKDLRDRSGRSGRLRFARRLADTTWRTTMAEANKLTLDSIRGGRLPGRARRAVDPELLATINEFIGRV